MPVTPLYAPTAKVLQLNEQVIADDDELILSHVNYSFSRRVRWTTILDWYADSRFEVMPQQLFRLQEYTIHREEWPPNEIDALEIFVDAHKGAALPFFFTVPDTGETAVVRFREDQAEYSVPSATVRTGDLVLVEVGDIDNTINNGLIYPDYVESTTTSSSSTTTTTT
jgi:hypothetical protein